MRIVTAQGLNFQRPLKNFDQLMGGAFAERPKGLHDRAVPWRCLHPVGQAGDSGDFQTQRPGLDCFWTVDMPTASAPRRWSMRISAGVLIPGTMHRRIHALVQWLPLAGCGSAKTFPKPCAVNFGHIHKMWSTYERCFVL